MTAAIDLDMTRATDRSIYAEAEIALLDVIVARPEDFARLVVAAHERGQWRLLRKLVERRARYQRMQELEALGKDL